MINTTNITNSEGFIEIIIALNIASSGLVGFFIWLSPYILLPIIFFRFGLRAGFSTACYVGAVLSLILRISNVIGDSLLFTSIVFVVLISMVLYFEKQG